MINWKSIVEAQHVRGHSDDAYNLVMQSPASNDDLLAIHALFGPAMTDEMKNLYEQIDGFGVEPSPEGTYWFVTPIAKLPEMIEQCRSWFRDTHPDLASRFFPFINWNCGDYTGYLLSEDGVRVEGLFTFEHEEYEFDEDQEGSEFLFTVYTTIEDLLAGE